MAKSILAKQNDGTITLTMTIPWDSVVKTREEVVTDMVNRADIPGFRKGKAPRKIVEEKLNPDQITEEILKKLLPIAYSQAVTEHSIKPIMNPKLHVEKIESDKDWLVSAKTCEMPEVKLGEYKKEIQKITAKSKIIIPGKEPQKPSSEEIIKALLQAASVQIPAILAEQETDRLLAQLLDDIKKLGLGLDQYLATTKRSADELRKEYLARAENDIKLEFALQKVSETEKITVEPKEIDEAIQKAKNPAEKQNLEANRYLLAGILRQQKTLDFLMGL